MHLFNPHFDFEIVMRGILIVLSHLFFWNFRTYVKCY